MTEFFRNQEQFENVREHIRLRLTNQAIEYGEFELQSGKKSRYRINVEKALNSPKEKMMAASLIYE